MTISGLEGNERGWKDILAEKDQQLEAKNSEIGELNVKVAQLTLQLDDLNSGTKEKPEQMAAEDEIQELMDELQRLRGQLSDKDTLISRLKKQIGDQRIKRNRGSPKHDHSFSLTSPNDPSAKPFEELTYPGTNSGFFEQVAVEDLKIMRICQKMVNASASLECEFCRHIIATQAFPDHIKTCKSDSLEVSAIIPSLGSRDFRGNSEVMEPAARVRLEELERTVYELRINIGELKNERDKAKLECEKLLIQLKHVKLEWAMAEERTADKELDLKRNVKVVLDGLLGLQAILEEGSEVYNSLEDLVDRTRECLSRGFRSKSRSGLASPKGQMADS